jgi:hypothetical protein
MSAHILATFIQKTNKARRVRFLPLDSGTVEVLSTILVLSSIHERAHASVSGNLNMGWTFCEQQRELRSKCSAMENGLGGKLSEYLFHVMKSVLF